jgi:hypothetical protein
MRGVFCLMVLCFATGSALAESVSPPSLPTEKSAKDIQEINERVAYWLTTCLKDWDAATHMTRKEWRTTCERVAVERRTFLLQDPGAFTMNGKIRQR